MTFLPVNENLRSRGRAPLDLVQQSCLFVSTALLALICSTNLRAQTLWVESGVPKFAQLPDLQSLHALQLDPQSNDASLAYVKDLQNLRNLAMQESRVTSEGLKNLSGLVHLEKLNLDKTHVGDAGLAHLKSLIELKRLQLAGTEVTGAGLASLESLRKLEYLDLTGQKFIFDADLVHLKNLTALKQLSVGNALFAGPGLEYIHGLKKLEQLVLPKDGLDESAVKRLQEAIPQAKIIRLAEYRTSYRDACSPEWNGMVCEPYWAGDYPRFEQILSQWVEVPRHTWVTTLWLGHAHWLQGDRRKAAEAYHRAIQEFEKELAAPITENEDRRYPRNRNTSGDWWPLVRFVSEFELQELLDPAAATQTLSLADRHYAGGLYETDMNEFMIGQGYERAGDLAAAMENYVRAQYFDTTKINGDASPMRDDYESRIAGLREKLAGRKVPATSCVAVLSDKVRDAKFEPGKRDPGSLPKRWSQTFDEDVFAVVAPPGKLFKSLDFSFVPTESFHELIGRRGTPPYEVRNETPTTKDAVFAEPRAIETMPWIHAEEVAGHPEPWTWKINSVDIAYFCVARKAGHCGISQLKVRATQIVDAPPPQPPPASRAARRAETIGPFEAVPIELPRYEALELNDAALAKLPDGSRLMAFPAPGVTKQRGIMLTSSADGRQWDQPWSFQYNDLCDCMSPTLFVQGQEICMFYHCNRFDLSSSYGELHGNPKYMLWMTRSRDARTWTPPVAVRGTTDQDLLPDRWSVRYPKPVLRMPDGTYTMLNGLMMTGMSILHGIGPGHFAEESIPEYWPADGWSQDVMMLNGKRLAVAQDRDNRCHCITWWGTGDIYYCRLQGATRLTNATEAFHADPDIRTFIPVTDGKRLLIVYASEKEAFLRGGTIEGGRPKFGEAIPLPGLDCRDLGRQFLYDNGQLWLPIGREFDPALIREMQIEAAQLSPFGPGHRIVKRRPGSRAGPSLLAGESGPCLLRGDFEKVFNAVAPHGRN